jgi:membrane associated rhomboid family serine protease
MRLSGRKRSSYAQHSTERKRLALLTLIWMNIAVFILQLFLEVFQPGSVRELLGLSQRGIDQAYSWQFVTAIFLHDGPWHLLGNMLIFYLLGRDLEVIIGQRHFVYLYLSGAIAGELGHLFLLPANTVLFAASGGVAAVVAAYATILPELELTAMVLFTVPIRLKAKHIAYGAMALAAVLVCVDRGGMVIHSAYLGGGAAGWLYAHLLGFGRPSFLQRLLRHHQLEAERLDHMTVDELMAFEIDPLLEKISRKGFPSLTRSERRALARARIKILQKDGQELRP